MRCFFGAFDVHDLFLFESADAVHASIVELILSAVAFLILVTGISVADEKQPDRPGKSAVIQTSPAQDPSKAEESERREDAERAAAEFQISFDNDPDTPVKLRTKPVLAWPNNERGASAGGTFLWTTRGIPVAMCDIFWYKDGRHTAFHSLTREPIMAEIDGRVVWHPRRAGVQLAPVPETTVPATTVTGRLSEMRKIARDFQAATLDDKGADAEQLRLLTQPLYRYESADPTITDGALFAFVTGTDPEVILQIEARRDDNAQSAWQYALTRRSGFPLRAKYQGKEVWSVPPGRGSIDAIYYEK